MLLSFSVANYKVFKDEVTLDMVATADKRFEENYLTVDNKRRVLKSAALYGANATGKTTLFDAMTLFRNFVIQSPIHQDDVLLNYTPFSLNPKCSKKPTSFHIEFIDNNIRYDYGFSYDTQGIKEEHLFYYPKGKKKMVFVRNGKDYSFGTDKKYREGNARRVRDKALFLSVSAQFNDEICIAATKWIINNLLILCRVNITESMDRLINAINSNQKFRALVKKAFQIADFGISNIFDNNKKTREVGMMISVTDIGIPPGIVQDIRVEHNVNGKKLTLPLAMESSGTIRFMSVIGPVISALQNGLTLIIDEMDLSFHTDVCQWILGLFLNPTENKHGAQLIFNTHEVGLLDQNIIRRDQVWFTMKDWETGSATLRRLSEYRIRNDLDIRRAYLNGSFGAKPFIAPERLME